MLQTDARHRAGQSINIWQALNELRLGLFWNFLQSRRCKIEEAELGKLNEHLLKDIGYSGKRIDLLKNKYAWNDPMAVEFRR